MKWFYTRFETTVPSTPLGPRRQGARTSAFVEIEHDRGVRFVSSPLFPVDQQQALTASSLTMMLGVVASTIAGFRSDGKDYR